MQSFISFVARARKDFFERPEQSSWALGMFDAGACDFFASALAASVLFASALAASVLFAFPEPSAIKKASKMLFVNIVEAFMFSVKKVLQDYRPIE